MKCKLSLCLISIFIYLSGSLFAHQVVSPTEGKWANYQSLVLNIPEGHNAYYSATDENPLNFGLAYDGPVLLELDGDVSLKISIVDDKGSEESYQIDYTVDREATPKYIPGYSWQSTILIDGISSILIPETVQYSINDNDLYYWGELLSIEKNMDFKRFVPLTIKENDVLYRYVLQIGQDRLDNQILVKSKEPISIIDWNTIIFDTELPVVYSINDGALEISNSGTIFVERSDDIELKFKSKNASLNDDFSTIFLPKKPSVFGLPKNPVINSAVTLFLSDSRYVFGKDLIDGSTIALSQFFVDTIKGDAFGIAEEIPIYFEGIKHGDLKTAFIIDKIPPQEPTFIASDNSGFSRLTINLAIESSDQVLYYIPEAKTSATGFSSIEYKNVTNVKDLNVDDFIPFEDEIITLSNTSTLAESYEIFAYAKDFAGNKSDIIQFKTVIDPYNYYLTQKIGLHATYLPKGTIDDPFINFNQLEKMLNKTDFQNIYFDGVFSDLSTIDITKSTAFYASPLARLIFKTGENLRITNSSLNITGGTIEQFKSEEQSMVKNSLIQAENSMLAINDCEIVLNGGTNNNGISLENSSLTLKDSGLSVQSLGYSSGILANNSFVTVDTLRLILVSETTIGMSFVNTSSEIKNINFIGTGMYSRAMESIDSNISLQDNSFIFENIGQYSRLKAPAIWLDVESNIHGNLNSAYVGFTELLSIKD